MSEVLKSVRVGVFATVAAWAAVWAIAGWVSLAAGTTGEHESLARRRTYNAGALLSTLPRVLVPPVVPSERPLVAMVAKDIDADGDLDVVANDGALHLLVWINDGTGRLTQREARRRSGIGQEPSGPGFASEPIGLEPAIHGTSFVPARSSFASVLAARSRPRSDASPAAPLSAFLAHRPSRAPPVLVPLS